MRYIYILLFLCGSLQGASWTPPATIPATPTISAELDVFGVYNSATQQMFASWAHFNGSNSIGYYSTYTSSTGWATPLPVDPVNDLFEVTYMTFVNSGPDANKIFLTGIGPSFFPVSYIFDSSSGLWGSQIPISTLINVQSEVTSVFRPTTETVFAAWVDSIHVPQIAYYHAGAWTVESTPPSGTVRSIGIFMAYDSANDTVFAAWVDSVTLLPVYWTYTGSGPWMGPFSITGASTARENVVLVYNEMLQSIVATWADGGTGTPTYSIFHNGSWMPHPLPIATGDTFDVFTAYDSDTGQVFASWGSLLTYPYTIAAYSILDPVSLMWSPEGVITGSQPAFRLDVTIAYASGLRSMFAFWSEGSYPYVFPTWSLYFQPPPVPGPISNLTGKLLVNDFGTESELFTRLHWSPSPTSNLEGYRIFDNGILIAIVSPSTTSYAAHNLPKGVNLITVIAFNANGESTPVSILLRPAHL